MLHSKIQLSPLNGCLVVYEWFGLQFFSFRTSLEKNFKDSISISRKIYFTIIFAVFFMLGCSSIGLLAMTSEVNARNVLTQIYSQSIVFVSFMTLCVGCFQSFVSTKHIKKMFSYTEEIVQITYKELKIPLSFESICKSTWRRFFVMACVFVTSNATIYYFSSPSLEEIIASFIVLITIGSYFILIVVKFLFYVCLINFKLDFVNMLLEYTFNLNSKAFEVEFFTIDMKNVDNKSNSRLTFSKLRTVWSIYDKVQENAALINKSMGITMLFALMNMIMILVNCGYIFCTVAMGDSTDLFDGKYSLCKK